MRFETTQCGNNAKMVQKKFFDSDFDTNYVDGKSDRRKRFKKIKEPL